MQLITEECDMPEKAGARTKKNILYSTFIGLEVEISNSSQHDLIGLKGKVVDETKNLLIIEKSDGKEVKIPKVSSIFTFTLDDGSKMEILGKKICFRPEERPKKV
jgi:ribonuclease P protein subunit POP4